MTYNEMDEPNEDPIAEAFEILGKYQGLLHELPIDQRIQLMRLAQHRDEELNRNLINSTIGDMVELFVKDEKKRRNMYLWANPN